MKTNWKYIFIVLILALLAGGGILWLVKTQEVPFTQLPEIKRQTISPQHKIVDWKTYGNEGYGFGINYPADWTFQENEIFTSIFKNNCHFDIHRLNEENYNEMIRYAESGGTNGCSMEDLYINQTSAKKVSCNAKWDAENYDGYYISNPHLRILSWDEKDFYLKPGEPIPADFINCDKIFNQMLFTFRFLGQ